VGIELCPRFVRPLNFVFSTRYLWRKGSGKATASINFSLISTSFTFHPFSLFYAILIPWDSIVWFNVSKNSF
jgi:hypothetical protein